MTARLLSIRALGLVAYDEAWALQREVARKRISGEEPNDVLLLVQHPPVVTLGRSTKPGHLLATADELQALGVQLREVERGGDVTIHEPGQLVVYPIIDLKQHTQDRHWYLRQVEEAIIVALRRVGLETQRVAGLTGVWSEDVNGTRKLASIGVRAREWITWHGFALNVENDLSTFAYTVPCGIGGVEMTTVQRECARAQKPEPSMQQVSSAVAEAFAEVFALDARYE